MIGEKKFFILSQDTDIAVSEKELYEKILFKEAVCDIADNRHTYVFLGAFVLLGEG